MTERGKNLVLLLATVCLTLLFCEASLRLWHGIYPFDFDHRRARPTVAPGHLRTGRYDSTLGWALKVPLDTPRFHTVEPGIRRNSEAQTGLRVGNILAVGSSFTLGSEVADEESWPAQVEALTGGPVDNAAVAGFALDQIVLRAEQLLPVARPRVLLVGLMDSVIEWSGFSINGRPKPFFTVENGDLALHNSPVPTLDQAVPLERIRRAVRHSHLLDHMLERIDPGGHSGRRRRAGNDPVDVGCRLLARLRRETDLLKIRTILVSEAKATDVMAGDSPLPRLAGVEACARAMGLPIVDTFGAFRAQYKSDPALLRSYYVARWDGLLNHFSAIGNRRVAEMVAAALSADR
jgi:hypothetical protein